MNDTARLARLPLPLPDELSRPRLLERLNGRWHAPVTVIEAGAGFGKSTLLAQAVRANTLEPRGIDVWHACTPGDVDGEVLGQAVLEALGVAGRYHDPAIQIADALAAYSPIDVCVLLDDAHEVRPGSSGGELLDRLVRRLPDNAHLVLAARHAPSVRLSRLPRRGPAGGDHPGRPAVHAHRAGHHGQPARPRTGRGHLVGRLARPRASGARRAAGSRHRLRPGRGALQPQPRPTLRPVCAVEPRLCRPPSAWVEWSVQPSISPTSPPWYRSSLGPRRACFAPMTCGPRRSSRPDPGGDRAPSDAGSR